MTAGGGLLAVLETARALRGQDQPFALALVTDTEGSTYRKAGALALVAGNRERTGTLSGGCLEPALEALAARVIASGVPEAAVFDTRDDDDLLFGSGSGCRGRMRVLAWPLPGAGDALLDALLAAHAAGSPLELSVGVEDATLGTLAFDGSARAGFLPVCVAPVRRLLDALDDLPAFALDLFRRQRRIERDGKQIAQPVGRDEAHLDREGHRCASALEPRPQLAQDRFDAGAGERGLDITHGIGRDSVGFGLRMRRRGAIRRRRAGGERQRQIGDGAGQGAGDGHELPADQPVAARGVEARHAAQGGA